MLFTFLVFRTLIIIILSWEGQENWSCHLKVKYHWPGHRKIQRVEIIITPKMEIEDTQKLLFQNFFLFMILVCSRRVKDVSNVLLTCTFRNFKILELTGWLRAVSYPECYTRLGKFLTLQSTLITTGRGHSLIFQISPRDDTEERRRSWNLKHKWVIMKTAQYILKNWINRL